MKISAVIIASNEADRIGKCLASIAWVDEIVVVIDDKSNDGTADICRKAGAKVVIQPWLGFAAQRQVSIDNASHDWLLMIDADEQATPELQAEIRKISDSNAVGGDPLALSAYHIRIETVFWGRILRCLSPDYHLRLFHKGSGQIAFREVHESWLVNPGIKVGRLKSVILHHSFRDLNHLLQKHHQYAELGAGQIVKSKRINTIFPALIRLFINFGKCFFLKRGFLDGSAGLIFSLVYACYFFNKYAIAYELTRQQKAKPLGVE